MSGLGYRWQITREVLAAPRVSVRLIGPGMPRRVYVTYTGRHPRFKLMARKEWGVAMLELPESMDAYLEGRARQHLRRKRRRALARGFAFREFDSLERVDEMMAIHLSAPARQGSVIDPAYTDRSQVTRFCERNRSFFGVFNDRDELRAYTFAPGLGEAASFHRLLGHADNLVDGVMYLLVSEVIRVWIEQRRSFGQPRWAFYDTFWGAKPGLAEFKRRTGFRPYRVRWEWSEHG